MYYIYEDSYAYNSQLHCIREEMAIITNGKDIEAKNIGNVIIP